MLKLKLKKFPFLEFEGDDASRDFQIGDTVTQLKFVGLFEDSNLPTSDCWTWTPVLHRLDDIKHKSHYKFHEEEEARPL